MDEGLLPGERKCPVSNCGHPMRLHQSSAYPDGCYWYCGHVNKKNKRRCKKNLSVRTGTWFSQSRLYLVEIVSLITFHGKLYLLIGFFFADLDCIYIIWWRGTPSDQIIEDLQINDRETIAHWNRKSREIAVIMCFVLSEPIGGPGSVVEIDESMFGKRELFHFNFDLH